MSKLRFTDSDSGESRTRPSNFSGKLLIEKPKALSDSGEDQKHNKVLLVDDEADMLFVISQVLSKHGFSVDSASSRSKALELLKENPYDAVVSDFAMEGEEIGFDSFVSALRNNHPDLPILLASGNRKENLEKEIASVDGFLQKPFEFSELAEAVRSIIQSGRRR